MLIKADVFKKTGLMDEKYFVYYDDTDFVWRATKYNNEILGYIHNSLIWHKVSSSTGGDNSDFSIYHLSRNHLYFSLKHLRGLHLFAFICYFILHFFFRKPFIYTPKQFKLITSSYKDAWRLFDNKL